MRIKKLALGLATVLCMSVVITGCNMKKTKDYEKPVETLCEAKESGDVDSFLELFGPLKSLMGSVVTDDVFKDMTDKYKKACGDNYKITYEITKEEKMDEDAIKQIEDNFSTFSSEEDVSEGYILEVKETAKGKKDKEENTMNLSVGKVDGKWYIVNFDASLLNND